MTTRLLLTLDGLPPALNHAYEARGGGARGLSHDAATWRNSAIYQIRDAVNGAGWHQPPHTPLYIGAVFTGPNAAGWDLDNRWKVLCDALKHGLHVDDAHFAYLAGEKREAPTARTRVLVLPWAPLADVLSPLQPPIGYALIDPPAPYTAEGDGDLTTLRGGF